MALTNIPILSAMPDVFSAYSTDPALSFIVDLIILSALFAALLSPLAAKTFGRDTEPGHGKKNKFGAILGIVLGAGAAFSLRAAGIQLLRYWLTAIIGALLLGAVIYKFLRKLKVSNLAAIAVSVVLALMIMNPLLSGSTNETVRSLFGFLSMLLPMAFLLFVIWASTQMGRRGGGGGGGEPRPPREPRPPGFLRRMFGEHGLLGAPGKIWDTIKYGRHPPAKEKTQAEIDAERLAYEEARAGEGRPATVPQAAQQPARDIAQGERIAAEGEAAAQGVQRGAQELEEAAEFTLDEANRVQAAAGRGNIEQLCTELERLVANIKATIQKPMQTHQGKVGILVNLGNRINKEVLEPYNAHIRALQAATQQEIQDMERILSSIPASPERENRERSLQEFKTTTAKLAELHRIANTLNDMLRFLQSSQLTQLYDNIKELSKDLAEFVKTMPTNCRQLQEAEVQEFLRKVNERMPVLQQNIEGIIRASRQMKEKAEQLRIVARSVRGEITHWRNTYNETLTRVLQRYNQLKEELKRAPAAPVPPQPPRPTPPPRPAEAREQPRPAAVSGRPVDDIKATVSRNSRLLYALSRQTREAVEHINFPSPVIRQGRTAIKKPQMEEMAANVITAAKRESGFDAGAEATAARALQDLKEVDQYLTARLAMQIPDDERAQLTQLKQKLAGFVRIYNTAVVPMLVMLHESVKQITVKFIESRKSVTVSNDVITRGVKQPLLALEDQIDLALRPLVGRPQPIQPRR
jgi:hypothetical protein